MIDQADSIKQFILLHITHHSSDIVAVAAKHFNVTRTTIHRHLNALIRQGQILKSGTTRNINYVSKATLDRCFTYTIKPELSEFDVLQEKFQDIFQQFQSNIYDVCTYGFTEIFNNAIEHSKGSKITVSTRFHDAQLVITIQDNGIGIFRSIYDYFRLDDLRESVLQLSKGKTTTDPLNHSGEGIFFTSRVFTYFEIIANQLHYFRDNQEKDWALETIDIKTIGSIVRMTIRSDSSVHLMSVFKHYQDPETLAFNRTEIVIELSRLGNEPLISRSQAKRVIVGLEKFQHVTLDFSGVRLVGQGFVDELFRVFANAHPTITIEYIHANDDVTFMIKRGLANRQLR